MLLVNPGPYAFFAPSIVWSAGRSRAKWLLRVRARPAVFSTPFSRAATRMPSSTRRPASASTSRSRNSDSTEKSNPGSSSSRHEGVLEVDPGPDRFRGLPVGEPFDELQHQYQREPNR